MLGPEDNVRCYWCGGSLKAWQPTDQPMMEHLRWFPECLFGQRQQFQFSVPLSVSMSHISTVICCMLMAFCLSKTVVTCECYSDALELHQFCTRVFLLCCKDCKFFLCAAALCTTSTPCFHVSDLFFLPSQFRLVP